jgi:predicted dehydrogenase
VTIRESQTVVEAVRRYSRVYQGGTQQRSDREGKFRRASEFVRSGRLGKLKEIYCYRDGGAIGWPPRSPSAQAVPAGLDWDLFLGPAPAIPYDGNTDAHRFDLGELNWGQHHCDIVQWATGADESGPVEVFLEKNRSGLKYADGAVVYGRPHPEEPTGATGGACFVGTEGRIAVDRTALVSRPGHLVSAPLRPNEVHLSWSEDHAEDFLEAVRTRKRPICDEMVAHRSVSALLLGGISKQLNRTLRWDPRTERFTNDDQANRLLSIATRPPWHI